MARQWRPAVGAAARWGAAASAAAMLVAAPQSAAARPDPPARSYYVYACAESEDEVALVRYGPGGLEVVRRVPVGRWPAETEGPHGIAVDPDGRHWYVSIAHGTPFGSVHKYATGTDARVGAVTLGMYPATLAIAPATRLLFAANFDLHGPPIAGSVSVVEIDTMQEVERIETGVMPHGSRLSADGAAHYSVTMMGSELIEIDALGLEVARRLPLGAGVQPTWVTAPASGGVVYVAGNGAGSILEVDLDAWRIQRTLAAGGGPYNLALTPDAATLIATYKGSGEVGFWDVAAGRERARVATSRTVPHGVVVTPDGAYAFVSVEGVGGEPGAVEVYDVRTAARLDAVDIGKQASGIAFWTVRDE